MQIRDVGDTQMRQMLRMRERARESPHPELLRIVALEAILSLQTGFGVFCSAPRNVVQGGHSATLYAPGRRPPVRSRTRALGRSEV